MFTAKIPGRIQLSVIRIRGFSKVVSVRKFTYLREKVYIKKIM